jgi:hypothetical protein
MARILKVLSIVAGLFAAGFWFMSASVRIPLAPGAALGGTSPMDPFNVAIRHAAILNQWAAGLTCLSITATVLAEMVGFWVRRRI